jgi:hypothetical protein
VGLIFQVLATEGRARRGRLTLAHGVVETPAFMPVGTRAAVKSVTMDDVRALGAEIVLANTYHLHLRPGDPLIARAGGLPFMGWDRPSSPTSATRPSLAERRTPGEGVVPVTSHRQPGLLARIGADIQARFVGCRDDVRRVSELAGHTRRNARDDDAHAGGAARP